MREGALKGNAKGHTRKAMREGALKGTHLQPLADALT